MKDVPDIAPEIRGLLEEIVADPRSAIRLAPRRALSTWFDTGETARASDVSRTKAERHLVEVHREELAALLCEAAWISYWKAPVLAHRPVDSEGNLYSPTEREPDWRRRADPEKDSIDLGNGVELLARCLTGIQPNDGCRLALASLGLVPSDTTRSYLAVNIPWSKPRAAIVLFQRLLVRARAPRLGDILLSLAARECSLGLLAEAREHYRRSCSLSRDACYGWICAFNLSCFLGDEKAARLEARELDKLTSVRDPRFVEECDLIQVWSRTQAEGSLEQARDVSDRIAEDAPEFLESYRRMLRT